MLSVLGASFGWHLISRLIPNTTVAHSINVTIGFCFLWIPPVVMAACIIYCFSRTARVAVLMRNRTTNKLAWVWCQVSLSNQRKKFTTGAAPFFLFLLYIPPVKALLIVIFPSSFLSSGGLVKNKAFISHSAQQGYHSVSKYKDIPGIGFSY